MKYRSKGQTLGYVSRSSRRRWYSRIWILVVCFLIACQLAATFFYLYQHTLDDTPPPEDEGEDQDYVKPVMNDDDPEPLEVYEGAAKDEDKGKDTDTNTKDVHKDREDNKGSTSFVTPFSPRELLRPQRLNECRQGDAIGLCAQDPRVLYAVEFEYPPFVIDMPKFINKAHQAMFFQLQQVTNYVKDHNAKLCHQTTCVGADIDPSEQLIFHSPQFTQGQLVVLKDGLYFRRPATGFGGRYECEWPGNYSMLFSHTQVYKNTTRHDKLALFVGPQAASFQHFMDRLMPDIVQAWELISSDPSWTIVGPRKSVDVRGEIWSHIFRNHPKYLSVFPLPAPMAAKQILYPCRVPRYHPWIWQTMQNMFGVVPVPLEQRTKIVYLPRGRSRKVLNEDELIEAMQAFIAKRNIPGEELVVFKHTDYPGFEATRNFFNQHVKAVIGAHGGAFYNINFAESDTLVVEFFPVARGGRKALRYPEGTWWQAAFLKHNYYLVPIVAATPKGDLIVNVEEIISVLAKEL